MAKVLIMRHAETTYNEMGLLTGRGADPHLTDKGRRQAENTAKFLKDNYIDHIELIVSSNMTRTNQTVEIVNIHLNKPIIFDIEIQEKHQGGFEGHHKDYALPIVNGMPHDVSHPIHGGESRKEFDERIIKAICNYLLMSEKTILLVSHGFVIERALLHFHEVEQSAHNGYVYAIDPKEIDMQGKCLMNVGDEEL